MDRVCKQCGIDISHKRSDAKACSKVCKDKYKDARRNPNPLPRQRRAAERTPDEEKNYYRTWQARKKGMDIECYQTTYDLHYADQDGKCGICDRALQPGKSTHMDHDHETGQVRGLLCSQCNLAIGLLGDTLSDLTRATSYLQRAGGISNDEPGVLPTVGPGVV